MLLRGFISDAKSIGSCVTLQQIKWNGKRRVPGIIYGVDTCEITENVQSVDFAFFTDSRYFQKTNTFKSLPKVIFKEFTFPQKMRFSDVTIEKLTVSDTALYAFKFDRQSTRILTLSTKENKDIVLKYNYPSRLLYKPYYFDSDKPSEDW